MEFRRKVGLRADEAWVRAVAENPASQVGTESYEIPLMPQEYEDLQSRLDRREDALSFGRSYAQTFPDGFAGVAIDPAAGDRLVLMYAKDVDVHQDRIDGLFPNALRPEVRTATSTLSELLTARSAIEEGTALDTALDPAITLYEVRIDILANRVVIDFGGPSPEAGEAAFRRFGSNRLIALRWFGPTEPVDRPVGGLLVTVVNAAGDAVAGYPCRYMSLDSAVPADGGGSTSDRGQCRWLRVPAVVYRLVILEPDEQVDRIVATETVEVVAGGIREVSIVIP